MPAFNDSTVRNFFLWNMDVVVKGSLVEIPYYDFVVPFICTFLLVTVPSFHDCCDD